MTVETAIQWLEVIAGLYDGTPQRNEQIIFLSRELMERPGGFAQRFFESLNEGDPIRERARRLLQTGAITPPETTFGEAAKLLRQGVDA